LNINLHVLYFISLGVIIINFGGSMKLFANHSETFIKIKKPLIVVVIIVLWGVGLTGLKLTAKSEPEQTGTTTQNQKTDQETFEQCRKEAEVGMPAAQYELSLMYASGEGAEKNEAKSAEWCEKAAAAGHPEAIIDLGFKYYSGNHWTTTPDYAKAFEYYQKAAASGHPEANFRTGVMCLYGEGVKQDDAKAFEYFQEAAESGHRSAKYKLGWMYAHGRGVEKNEAKSAFWYNNLSKQNRLSR